MKTFYLTPTTTSIVNSNKVICTLFEPAFSYEIDIFCNAFRYYSALRDANVTGEAFRSHYPDFTIDDYVNPDCPLNKKCGPALFNHTYAWYPPTSHTHTHTHTHTYSLTTDATTTRTRTHTSPPPCVHTAHPHTATVTTTHTPTSFASLRVAF
jgi:hypothetical protein